MVPSIKGVGIQLAADAVRRVVQAGFLSEEELQRRLSPQDLKILESEILPGLWYPIETCGKLIDIAAKADGGGDAAYLENVGVRVAKTFFSSAVYNPFISAGEKHGPGSGKILISMTNIALNFSKWTYEARSEKSPEFIIEVSEADAFPEVLRFIALGFIKYLAKRLSAAPIIVTSLRPTPDRIVFEGIAAG